MRRIDNLSNTNGYIRISPTTAIRFYYKEKQYKTGSVGVTTAWVKYHSTLTDVEKDIDVFWVDWRGSYGDQQIQAMSQGVYDLCTLRMSYHPDIYQLLRTKEVLIIKDASTTAINASGAPVLSDPDVYYLWGAVDDIRNLRRIMEFKVRRFEPK